MGCWSRSGGRNDCGGGERFCEDDVPLGDHLPLTAFRGAWQVGDEDLLIVSGADLDHALVKEDAHSFASQCEAKASGEAPCAYVLGIDM